MNRVCLIGRLVADPEARTAQNKDKTMIVNFRIAVDRAGSEEADFIRITAFGKTAEFADQWFKKGMRVGIDGRIQTGSYEDKNGNTVYTTDIITERLDFADGKTEDANGGRRRR